MIIYWTDAPSPCLTDLWRLVWVSGVRGRPRFSQACLSSKEWQFFDYISYMQQNLVVSSETRDSNKWTFYPHLKYILLCLPQSLESGTLAALYRLGDDVLVIPRGSMLNRSCAYLCNTCSLNWENFWIKHFKISKKYIQEMYHSVYSEHPRKKGERINQSYINKWLWVLGFLFILLINGLISLIKLMK